MVLHDRMKHDVNTFDAIFFENMNFPGRLDLLQQLFFGTLMIYQLLI